MENQPNQNDENQINDPFGFHTLTETANEYGTPEKMRENKGYNWKAVLETNMEIVNRATEDLGITYELSSTDEKLKFEYSPRLEDLDLTDRRKREIAADISIAQQSIQFYNYHASRNSLLQNELEETQIELDLLRKDANGIATLNETAGKIVNKFLDAGAEDGHQIGFIDHYAESDYASKDIKTLMLVGKLQDDRKRFLEAE